MSSELEHPNDILFGASLLFPDLVGTSLGVNALFDQDQQSYSAFTALTWNVNAQWRANFGLRYQKEEKEVSSVQNVYSVFEPNTPQAVQQFANAAAPTIAGQLSGAGVHNLNAKRDESHLSPNISAVSYTHLTLPTNREV